MRDFAPRVPGPPVRAVPGFRATQRLLDDYYDERQPIDVNYSTQEKHSPCAIIVGKSKVKKGWEATYDKSNPGPAAYYPNLMASSNHKFPKNCTIKGRTSYKSPSDEVPGPGAHYVEDPTVSSRIKRAPAYSITMRRKNNHTFVNKK